LFYSATNTIVITDSILHSIYITYIYTYYHCSTYHYRSDIPFSTYRLLYLLRLPPTIYFVRLIHSITSAVICLHHLPIVPSFGPYHLPVISSYYIYYHIHTCHLPTLQFLFFCDAIHLLTLFISGLSGITILCLLPFITTVFIVVPTTTGTVPHLPLMILMMPFHCSYLTHTQPTIVPITGDDLHSSIDYR